MGGVVFEWTGSGIYGHSLGHGATSYRDRH
jgi:hypothetical protein